MFHEFLGLMLIRFVFIINDDFPTFAMGGRPRNRMHFVNEENEKYRKKKFDMAYLYRA